MKLQCSCGAKYSFEVTPDMANQPVHFSCPACGMDYSEFVTNLVRQQLGPVQAAAIAPPPPGYVPPPSAVAPPPTPIAPPPAVAAATAAIGSVRVPAVTPPAANGPSPSVAPPPAPVTAPS